MTVHEVTDATFEQDVLGAELPVLVDLYADWCAPCKQLSPLVEQLAEELEGKLKVVKIDVDHNPVISQTFQVQSIPMLVVFKDGQVAGHHMGMLDKAGLRQLVEPALPESAAQMKPEELAQLLAKNGAVPVDVRDASAYARYRIPGAIHIPSADTASRATELKAADGRLRVLYSRTTDEAKELAEKLHQDGLDVAFLEGGFLHWEADGFEVERGT